MSTRIYPVTDKSGNRIGDAVRRTDGVTRIRFDREFTIPPPRRGEPDGVYVYVYVYVNPTPETLGEVDVRSIVPDPKVI